MGSKQTLINAFAFNIAWFGCVLIGNAFIPIVVVWLIYHLRNNATQKIERLFIVLVTIIGCLIDTALVQFGVFIFQGQSIFIPLWLMFIWLSFALTLNGCLAFLRISVGLQFIVGMIFAPLSYIAGSAFGAVQFGHSTTVTFAILSIVWSILLPSLYYVNHLIRVKYHVQQA